MVLSLTAGLLWYSICHRVVSLLHMQSHVKVVNSAVTTSTQQDIYHNMVAHSNMSTLHMCIEPKGLVPVSV